MHARDLRKPATTLGDVVDDWTGKCRFNAKWLAEQDEVTVTSSKITNDITGEEYSMQIEHCVELWFGAQLLNECTAATTDDVAHIRTLLNQEWNLFLVRPRENAMLAVVSKQIVEAFGEERGLPNLMPSWGHMRGLDWGGADRGSKVQVLAYLLHGMHEFAQRLQIGSIQKRVNELCVFVAGLLVGLPKDADGDYKDIPFCPREHSVFLEFKAARDVVRALKLANQIAWQTWSKHHRPSNIPSRPDKVYAGEGWAGFKDWLETGFLEFEEARKVVRAAKLAKKAAWDTWSKHHRPPNIPSRPDKVYAGKGWAGIKDWLGTINLQV